jgi:hypothetical protein
LLWCPATHLPVCAIAAVLSISERLNEQTQYDLCGQGENANDGVLLVARSEMPLWNTGLHAMHKLELKVPGTKNPKLPWLISLARPALDELEQEYLRIGSERCGHLRQQTQLSAFLLSGIRCLSLLRGMLRLLEPQFLDSHAALHRAFLECWYLQCDFRLRARTAQNLDFKTWFHPKSKMWERRGTRNMVRKTIEHLGGSPPDFNWEYDILSNAAHPTNEAAYSSELVVTATCGMSPHGETRLRGVLHDISDHYVNLLSRELWVSLFDHGELIETGLTKDKLKNALQLYEIFVVRQSKIDWGNIR